MCVNLGFTYPCQPTVPGDYYARPAGAAATITIISDDTNTNVIDGGGGATGYEPTNVQVVPGDGELTVSWTLTSRPDVDDNDIKHAVRWSQTYAKFDNPGMLPFDPDNQGARLEPKHGVLIEPGVASYKITGLENRVVTGVSVRSFTGNPRGQNAAASSRWVRVKGESTTPVADEALFDAAAYSVAEGGTVRLAMTRYAATGTSLDDALAVTLNTADGTAASSDYAAFSSHAVVMAAGSATAASNLVTTSDDLVEEDETLTVSMSVPPDSIFRVGEPATATITIQDDDRAHARIAFGSDAAGTTKYTATAAEADGTLNVPVTVSHLPGASTTFAVAVLSTGTATESSDFSIATKSVTFGPTDASKTKNVAITLTDDTDYEADETIELRIAAADNPANDLGDHYARHAAGSTATVTITSADARSSTKTYSVTRSVSATEGENAEITLTLGEAAPEGGLAFKVTATYPDPSYLAALPADTNNLRTATHTVAAGKTSSAISIPIAADDLVEGPEPFTVTVTTDDAQWSVASANANKATVLMKDATRASAKIAFGTDAASTTKYTATVAENNPNGYLDVPITISHHAGGQIGFNVTVLGTGTATQEADYRRIARSVTFRPSAKKTQNLRIPLINDSEYEQNETIELRIAAADNPANDLTDHYARDASGATATITITSDESHYVTASRATLTVAQDATATYTVVLTDQPTADVTVTPSSSTAATTVSGPVTFTRDNWSAPQEITVAATPTDEPTEARLDTISHTVSSADANFSSAKTESVKVTVPGVTSPTQRPAPTQTPNPTQTPDPTQTPPAPEPAVEPTKFYEITSAVTATEGKNAELTVTLSEAASAAMTFNVRYNYGGSTAIALDTGGGRPTTVTVASGKTTATLRVPIARDSSVESDETLKLSISGGSGVTAEWGPKADGADSATITIKDATITVSMGQATYTVGEADGSISVSIKFSSAIPENVLASLTFSRNGGIAHPTPLTVGQGKTTDSFDITIHDDNIEEADGKITVNFIATKPDTGYAIVAPRQAVITVTDDDTAGVTVSESARSVMEGNTTTYTVTLKSKPWHNVTITPTSGAADKATVSGAVTFKPDNWNQPQTITVTGVAEGTATISHAASSTDAFYLASLSIDSVAVTVTPSSVYDITSAATASEGGNAELTVTLYENAPTGGLEFTVTPAYATGAGKAAAADLNSPPTTVTVLENQRTATLSIPIARDALVEDTETFTVAVATDASGWSKIADSADTATVTITDLTRTVSLGASTYTVGESDGTVSVGLSVSGAHADAITATLTFTDGTATRNADYGDASTTAQVSFAADVTSATLDVDISDDNLAEGSETFTVTITAVSAGHAIHGSSNAATVTITDDDSKGVTIGSTSLSVPELDANGDNGEISYTIALDSEPTYSVTVTPTSSSTTHATVSGAVTFTTSNWQTAQEITVSGKQDGSATISHAVTSDDTEYNGLTPASVAVTVTPYGKTYTITPTVTVTEGNHARLVITMGQAVGLPAGLTFDIETTFDSPDTGKAQADDVGSVQSEVRVYVGTRNPTVSIPIPANDLLGEADETFTISITNVHSGGAPVPEWKLEPGGSKTTEVTIKDGGAAKIAFGDDAAATAAYTAGVLENVSGGTLNVPVTVSHLPVNSTTFAIAVDGTTGTATEYADTENPGDYRIADKTVTFGPTDTSKTKNVAITINDDDAVEAPETVVLSIAAARDPEVDLGDRYARDAAGATATITITSDEAPAGSTKTYTVSTPIPASEGANAQLGVALGENAPEGGLTFSVSYDYTSGAPGSRAAAADTGSARPTTFTVAAGAKFGTLNVPLALDRDEEGEETFTVTLATAAPGWTPASAGADTATVTITDATEAVKFSAGGYTVIEGNAANVVIMRTGPTDRPVQVGLMGGGRGISFFTKRVTIPAGASATTVTVETPDNTNVDGDRRPFLNLQNPPAGYRLLGSTFILITIKDDDGTEKYASTYTIENSEVSAPEGANAALTVKLGEAAHSDGLEFIVNYDYSGSSATEDDTGDAPTTLSVAPGTDEATLNIPIARDADDDDGETFVVSITPGARDTDWAVASGGSASATVTISGSSEVQQGGFVLPAVQAVSFDGQTISDKTFTVGASTPYPADNDSQERQRLPQVSGGRYVTYTATGLPDGLTMGHDRIIRGTPTTANATPVQVTYTATSGEAPESGARSASLTFNVTVKPAVKFDAEEIAAFKNTIFEYTVTQAEEITAKLPEATGGHGDLTYSLTYYVREKGEWNGEEIAVWVKKTIDADAPGWNFDAATRVLSSDSPTAEAFYSVDYQAVDQNGARAGAANSISVREAPTLPEVADQSFTVGESMSLTLPKAEGGSFVAVGFDYRLEPPVPGLLFNGRDSLRTLSGAPTFTGSAVMTYTATDRNGVSASRSFTLTITAGAGAPTSAPTVTTLNIADDRGDQYVVLDWADVANAGRYVVQVIAADGAFPAWAVETRPDEGWLFFYESRTDLGRDDGKQGQAVLGELAAGKYKVRVAGAKGNGAGPWSSEVAFTVP